MKKPTVGKIAWLFKKNNGGYNALGFLRMRGEREGCFIIGGPTGSHCTGHGEEWEGKLSEYVEQGYIDKENAIKENLISLDWSPPRISKGDQETIDGLMRDITGEILD